MKWRPRACVKCKWNDRCSGDQRRKVAGRGAVVFALRWASVTDDQVDPLQMFKNMNNEREAIEIRSCDAC